MIYIWHTMTYLWSMWKMWFILMVRVSILQTPPAKFGINFTSPAGCRLSQCTPRHIGDFKYKDQPRIREFETVLGCLMFFFSKRLFLLFGLGGDSPPCGFLGFGDPLLIAENSKTTVFFPQKRDMGWRFCKELEIVRKKVWKPVDCGYSQFLLMWLHLTAAGVCSPDLPTEIP